MSTLVTDPDGKNNQTGFDSDHFIACFLGFGVGGWKADDYQYATQKQRTLAS
ncbi:MAG: hypothetical protein ABJA18_08465 [bacterium]